MNNKKVLVPEGANETYVIFTKEKNAVKGNGGCNNFFGTYSKTGNDLKIGPVARTEMYCEQTMETENNFMKVLENTVRYKIKGNNLYLYDSGNTLAKLEAVYLK